MYTPVRPLNRPPGTLSITDAKTEFRIPWEVLLEWRGAGLPVVRKARMLLINRDDLERWISKVGWSGAATRRRRKKMKLFFMTASRREERKA